ncbi:guanylate-binding protein 5 [Erinaceus europaeus]|uniref:Guanylate-binding protein 5 n=1 Tax=Erinaceus europaeus TaxID=9365 RepID=A0ABM3YAA8_ERIEU|nr:guanylate-binding protein 5 [Erinaceus europaeus]
MVSETQMPDPMSLIENIEGKLLVNQEALKILSTITQPVDVVAIVGLYRTGKSYLMNKLAGKDKGFSVGSTVRSHTKGIWMWCMPHPNKPNHTLVLLDTEGLGDVEKGDKENDTQIFALAILLSSTFVYNTMNKIDQRSIDLLHYVTELSDLLRTVSSPEHDKVEDATSFYPDLVWTLRDFFLNLEVDGKPITADEYLKNSVMPKEDMDQRLHNFNLPRLCIQKFFPNKKCFIFDSPSHRKNLSRLETLHNNDLNPEFVQQITDFCSYIFCNSKTKTLPKGIIVNGPDLEKLVLTYVDAINHGDLPCTENSVLVLAQIKNTEAVQKAIAHYDHQMKEKVQLPTETLEELLDLHRVSEREATEVFMKISFRDEDQTYQKELEMLLEAKQNDFCKQNLKASRDHCSALLQKIFDPLEDDVKQGIYAKPGGHKLFIQKREELKAKYYQEPKKGMKAEETLQEYLQSKESMSNAVLQTDLTLTAKEKEMEAEHQRALAAQAEAQRLQEIQRQNQLMMEERERRHLEQVRQMEIERQRQIAEANRAMERRLQQEAEAHQRRIEEEMRKLVQTRQQLQANIPSNDPCIIL